MIVVDCADSVTEMVSVEAGGAGSVVVTTDAGRTIVEYRVTRVDSPRVVVRTLPPLVKVRVTVVGVPGKVMTIEFVRVLAGSVMYERIVVSLPGPVKLSVSICVVVP